MYANPNVTLATTRVIALKGKFTTASDLDSCNRKDIAMQLAEGGTWPLIRNGFES